MVNVNNAPDYKSLFGGAGRPTVEVGNEVDLTTLKSGYGLREAVGRLADKRVLTVDDAGFVGEKLGLNFDQKWAKGRLGGGATAATNGENLDAALMVDTTYGNGRPAKEIILGASASGLKLVRTERDGVAVSWWDKESNKRRGTMVDAVGGYPEVSAELRNILSTRGYLADGAYRALDDRVKMNVDEKGAAVLAGSQTVKLLVDAGRIVEEADRKAGAVEAVQRLVAYRPKPLDGPEGMLGKYGSRFDTLKDNPQDVILALWLLDQDGDQFVGAGGVDFAYVLGGDLQSCADYLEIFRGDYDHLPGRVGEGWMFRFFLGGGEEAMGKARELKDKIDAMSPPRNIAYGKGQ